MCLLMADDVFCVPLKSSWCIVSFCINNSMIVDFVSRNSISSYFVDDQKEHEEDYLRNIIDPMMMMMPIRYELEEHRDVHFDSVSEKRLKI